MYNAIKNNTVQYILDYEPTQEQLTELGCDSYDEYTEPEETYDAKKIRIVSYLISTPDISSIDLEWIVFNDKEIWDIILDRVFGWNPHAQSALLAKTNAYILSAISWDENIELLEEIKIKQAQINDVRAKFNLKSF